MSFLDKLLVGALGQYSTVQIVGPASIVARAGQLIACDPTSASPSVTAPASPLIGQFFGVCDQTAHAATHNITIQGNGVNIESTSAPGTYATTATISVNSQSVWWVNLGSIGWKIAFRAG